jgi:hypothetical protein
MKSGFQRDKLAQNENSSSQMKVLFGTAENGIQTAKYLSTTQVVRRKVKFVKVGFYDATFTQCINRNLLDDFAS